MNGLSAVQIAGARQLKSFSSGGGKYRRHARRFPFAALFPRTGSGPLLAEAFPPARLRRDKPKRQYWRKAAGVPDRRQAVCECEWARAPLLPPEPPAETPRNRPPPNERRDQKGGRGKS